MDTKLRLVKDGPEPGLETTRTRSLREVAEEARAREKAAMRNSRVSDAAMYAEIATRAEELADREARFRYAAEVLPREAADRERARLEEHARGLRQQRRLFWTLATIMVVTAAVLLSSCASIGGPAAGTLELGAGAQELSGHGSPDLGDLDPVPTLEVGGAVAEGDELTGVAGEWFLQLGRTEQRDVDAGELGLFDLEGEVVRFGAGVRVPTGRVLFLDSEVGLGACVTVLSGTATAGTDERDESGSGLGAYVHGMLYRGPLFLRLRYVAGPEVELGDSDVEVGGLSATGGLRWTF